MNLQTRFNDQSLWLEDLTYLSIKSYRESQALSWPLSFEFQASTSRLNDAPLCDSCYTNQINLGGGYAFIVAGIRAVGLGSFEISRIFGDRYFFSVGPKVIFDTTLMDRLTLQTELDWRYRFRRDSEWNLYARANIMLSKDLSLGAQVRHNLQETESSLRLHVYF